MHHEIAIVGAGMAGLICAKTLQDAGRDVVVIDKSRGLGGRLATRRLANTHADHGVCYLKPKGDRFKAFIQDLVDRNIVSLWSDRLHTLNADGELLLDANPSARYAAPNGATAIAKDLAQGLTVELGQVINAIRPIEQGWQLTSQNPDFDLTASIVILAIPAPQALPLVQTIANSEFIQQIEDVTFAPSLTAIAAYSPELRSQFTATNLRGVTCDDKILGWIGFDSTKQLNPTQPTIILQSNAEFASAHFDSTDLPAIAQQLCDRAAEVLALPTIATPELLQIQRWKYAFAVNPITAPVLAATTTAPLFCIGDWCGGNRVENAFLSGLAMAERLG